MKKFLGIILAVLMLATVAFAADITVTLNGEVVDCESYGSPATIVEGRTLVPLRAIFEALGASVEWDQATRTVSSSLGEDSIALTVGSNALIKNGEEITLDVPAQIINDRTMVPARAIAEAYGVGVEWDAATRTVVLTQVVEEEPVEEVDDSVIFTLTGENFTGSEGYNFTSGGNIVPEVVDDFAEEGNKVLFIHSTYTEKQAWTYFRNNSVKLEAGKRYLVKYRVSIEKDSSDNTLEKGNIGLCFRYGDTTEDGKTKDHGVYTITNVPGTWTDVCFIFTVPETLVASEATGVGIYANPVNGLPLSYYLDDVSLSVYEGLAEDGAQTKESLEAADAKATFDIDEAKGLVYDFDDTFDIKTAHASDKYVENGNLVLVAEGDMTDPILNFNGVSFAADDYNAVAVKFKVDNLGSREGGNAKKIQVYFTTDTEDKLSESKSSAVSYDDCLVDGEWYVAYIVMSGNESWSGNITSFRIDPANNTGVFTIDKVVVLEA